MTLPSGLTEAMIEAADKAACREDIRLMEVFSQQDRRDIILAALTAALAGRVVVPAEATRAMLDAVDSKVVGCCNMSDRDAEDCYRAMLAAAVEGDA